MNTFDTHLKIVKPLGLALLQQIYQTEDPRLRYRAHFLSYMMRYRSDFNSRLMEYVIKKKVDSSCVGLHVRRTDKVARKESHPLEVSGYMDKVADYYRLKPAGMRRCVYIATDDRQVIHEVVQKYSEYEIIYEVEHAKHTSPSDLTADRLESLLLDLHSLRVCGYFVGTMSSNIARLQYEFILLRYETTHGHFVSLDRNRFKNLW